MLHSNSDQKAQAYQIVLEGWLGLVQLGSLFTCTEPNGALCNTDLLWLELGGSVFTTGCESELILLIYGKGDGMYVWRVLRLSLKADGLQAVSGEELKRSLRQPSLRNQCHPSQSCKEINSANNQRTSDNEKRLCVCWVSHRCLLSFPTPQGHLLISEQSCGRAAPGPAACLQQWRAWTDELGVLGALLQRNALAWVLFKPNKEFCDSCLPVPCAGWRKTGEPITACFGW